MIDGMTDRTVAAFPCIGKIRKGAPKTKKTNKDGREVEIVGRDLTYFRIDTTDGRAAEILREVYGEEPRELRVYLRYATALENFDPYREYWKGGGLVHRCTGSVMVRHRLPGGAFSDKQAPCPHRHMDPNDRKRPCQPVGRLPVVFRELNRAVCFLLLTHSKNDIVRLDEQLKAAELEAGGNLIGVPFLLTRGPVTVSTPNGEQRVRREKWLLSMEINPTWWQRRLAATEQKALPPAITEIVGDPDEPDNSDPDVIDAEYEVPNTRAVAASARASHLQADDIYDIDPGWGGQPEEEQATTPGERRAAFNSAGKRRTGEDVARPAGAADDDQIQAITKLCEARGQDPDEACQSFADKTLATIDAEAAGELILHLQSQRAGNGKQKEAAASEPSRSELTPDPTDREAMIQQAHRLEEDCSALNVSDAELRALVKQHKVTNLASCPTAAIMAWRDGLKAKKRTAEEAAMPATV